MYFIECSPKTGDYTLALSNETHNKYYVLNKYEPKEKALKSLENVDWGNKSTIWILFGFQFGYLIDKLIEIVGEKVNVLVIEPEQAILEEELELCGHFYEKKIHIKFFSGTNWANLRDSLDQILTMENFNNYRVISNKEYLNYYNDYYKKVINLIDQRAEDKLVNYYTIILGNTHDILNTVKNRYELANTCDMSKLYNKFKDIPAVLVLAGPSLDKNIEYLKEFNGLIFVVGRTMTPVLKLGVKPDLVFALDPYAHSLATFGEYQKYDVPLVTMGQCSDIVVKGCQSPYKYFIYNSNELEGLLGIRVNPCLDLSGSVATLCLSTAEYFGCSPIIFIGQDLAYSGNKMYANNADALYDPEKLKKVDELRKIKGYYDDEVYSDVKMTSFLRWIERFIDQHPSSKYINCTEGGAYIEGAEHIPFKEAIELYNPSEKVIIHHEFLKINEGIDVNKNLREGIRGIQTIEKNIHQSIEDLDNLIGLYQEEKSIEEIGQKVVELLRRIEERDEEIEKIPHIKFLMNMLLERVKPAISASNDCKEPLHETQEEFKLRYLRVNRETYRYIEKECIKLLDLLEDEVPKKSPEELRMEKAFSIFDNF